MRVAEKNFDAFYLTSRRKLLVAGIAVVASLLEGHVPKAQNTSGIDCLKTYDATTNGISLHVCELGDGPAILFVHGFPDTAYTWHKQMQAVASAGFRAIAPDMRGYGRSSAALIVARTRDSMVERRNDASGSLLGSFLSRRPLLAPRQNQCAGCDEGGRA